MAAAPLLPVAGEAAATQTVTLTVIEGGAAASEATAAAVLGTEAVVAGEAAALGGGAALGAGAVIATGGIALLAIGAIALGYYLYRRSHQVPAKPQLVQPCPPDNPVEPVAKPNVEPKPVPIDKRIPDIDRAKEVARRQEEARKQRCNELWDSIQRRTNRRRKRAKAGQQGMKYRYWDMICSEHDPSTQKGREIWDNHKKAYEDDRSGLQREIDEFEEKCEGNLPEGAKDYADKEFPDKSEWRGNSPECAKYRQQREDRYDQYKNDPTADNG